MRRPLTLPLVLLLTAASADAEPRLRPLWEVGAGLGVLSLSDYPGADQESHYLVPIPYLVYRGKVLRIDRERIRGVLFERERWDIDVSVGATVPGRAGRNRARTGMPDLDPTLEIGPQLNLRLLDTDRYRLRFQLPVRNAHAVSGGLHEFGWLVSPILNLQVWNTGPGGGWKLTLFGGPSWADRRYHDYFYGVDSTLATATRPAYAAKSGYSGTYLNAVLSKRYRKFWVGGFVRVGDLHGTAFEDSPLVRRKTTYAAGFGISWVFGQSDEFVMADD